MRGSRRMFGLVGGSSLVGRGRGGRWDTCCRTCAVGGSSLVVELAVIKLAYILSQNSQIEAPKRRYALENHSRRCQYTKPPLTPIVAAMYAGNAENADLKYGTPSMITECSSLGI